MATPCTLGSVKATAGTPTPVYTGPVIAAVSFSIKNNIATIVLGADALPANGYNGPNQAIQGYPANPAGGQQVTLWGFSTATYFNGKVVSVIYNNPQIGSFSFYYDNGNSTVNSTDDAGNTAASPFQHYRAVRLEVGLSLNADIIYVGDLNVSSDQYMAALSTNGQTAIEITSENIPADRIFIDTNGDSDNDNVQVTLLY